MPTNRTRRTRPQQQQRITPEAIAAFVAGDELALHRALGLRPWDVSPLDCEGKCPWPARSGGAKSWPKAQALRAELEPAAQTKRTK